MTAALQMHSDHRAPGECTRGSVACDEKYASTDGVQRAATLLVPYLDGYTTTCEYLALGTEETSEILADAPVAGVSRIATGVTEAAVGRTDFLCRTRSFGEQPFFVESRAA